MKRKPLSLTLPPPSASASQISPPISPRLSPLKEEEEEEEEEDVEIEEVDSQPIVQKPTTPENEGKVFFLVKCVNVVPICRGR